MPGLSKASAKKPVTSVAPAELSHSSSAVTAGSKARRNASQSPSAGFGMESKGESMRRRKPGAVHSSVAQPNRRLISASANDSTSPTDTVATAPSPTKAAVTLACSGAKNGRQRNDPPGRA